MATKKKLLEAAAGVSTGPEGAWDLSYAYHDSPDAWNISSATYMQQYTSFTGYDTAPTAIFFKPDGTEFYHIGTVNDNVRQFSLSTPWLITTASLSQEFDVGSQEGASRGMFFKPDGTKMYIIGSSGDDVNEYDLSTAWSVSTASYVQNFSVAAQETTPRGIFFKTDGTKMYILGDSGNDVGEYSLTTAWDVSTASFVQSFSVGSQTPGPGDLSFKHDGTAMYVLNETGANILEYALSTAWDISSASYSQSYSVSTVEGTPTGFYIKPDGLGFYIIGLLYGRCFQYNMGGLNIVTEDIIPEGIFFKPDGTKLYMIGSSSDRVHEYALSTAWDTSSASLQFSYPVSGQDSAPTDVFFKPDGTKMYVLGDAGNDINEYNLSTAWDVSTASYLQVASVSTQDTGPEGFFFKPDGTKFYVYGYSSDKVHEFDLSTAWDITSYSYVQNFSVISEVPNARDVFFKDDGTKMYVSDITNDNIVEYSLSTAWDVSTASYTQSFLVSSQTPNAYGIFFKDDGTKMFTVCASSRAIYTYTLGVQP